MNVIVWVHLCKSINLVSLFKTWHLRPNLLYYTSKVKSNNRCSDGPAWQLETFMDFLEDYLLLCHLVIHRIYPGCLHVNEHFLSSTRGGLRDAIFQEHRTCTPHYSLHDSVRLFIWARHYTQVSCFSVQTGGTQGFLNQSSVRKLSHDWNIKLWLV